jgi:hypothetical protein
MLTPLREIVVEAYSRCTNGTAMLTGGNGVFVTDNPKKGQLQAIYKTAYRYTGTEWLPVELTGDHPSGDWFFGNALQRAPSVSNENNYVVMFICTLVDGQWKCAAMMSTAANRNGSCKIIGAMISCPGNRENTRQPIHVKTSN